MKYIVSGKFLYQCGYKGKLFADINRKCQYNFFGVIIQVFAQFPKFNYLKQLGKACYCEFF